MTDKISPYEVAKMLTEKYQSSRKKIPEKVLKELIEEMQAYFPGMNEMGARKQLEVFDPYKSKLKEINNIKVKKEFALSLARHYSNGKPENETLLAIDLEKNLKIPLKEAKSLARYSLNKMKDISHHIPAKIKEIKPVIEEKKEIEKVEVEKVGQLVGKSWIKLSPRDEQILLSIYLKIHQNLAQKYCFEKHSISKSAFYRGIKKLEKNGILAKIPGSFPTQLKVNPSFQKSSPIFLQVSFDDFPLSEVERKKLPLDPKDPEIDSKIDFKILRSHNFVYMIPYQKKPANLFILLEKSDFFEIVRMQGWNYYHGKLAFMGIEGHIRFNLHVVIVWLNNIYGRNVYVNTIEADKRIHEIKLHLEENYPGLILAPAQFIRRIPAGRNHHALIHHPLSLQAKRQNISLRSQNWEIDSSKNMPELEGKAYHVDQEMLDMEFKATNNVWIRDLHENQTEIGKLIKDMQKVQTQTLGGTLTAFQIAESALQAANEIKNQSSFFQKVKSFISHYRKK